ncbi:glycosyltransferase family 4 protein [Phycisphaerales bacterium AB-hyl4]|uniref:Glycosyltransferase family 4 protein n=1 Tax=Natronomicrosphaera hydrolytica TaxID=3242702 RepID=A0ABV4U5M0_9BACT
MSMRILCLSYEYPPIGGGGSPVCAGVAEALTAAGHRVDVVTSGMPGLARKANVNGVEVHRVPCLRRRRHMAGSFELATTLVPMYRQAMRLARESRYNLIHCHFILPTGIVARRVSVATGLPYVLTTHGSDVPGYNPDRFHLAHRIAAPLWRRVVRDATMITSPSRFLASLLRQRLDVPVRIVPNGMTVPARSAAPRRNRVLLASRLFERKGVQDMLRALAGWRNEWQIDIAGDGPYRPTLERLAREQRVNVRFLKLVPSDELAALYRTSKIFVFPSHRENFPVVLLEAMGGGCAVITAKTAGNSEVVGDAAISVEPGDSDALRSALQQLMHDESAIARLRERSYQRVRRFSWERVGAEYEALFERCLGKADNATGASSRAYESSDDALLSVSEHAGSGTAGSADREQEQVRS